MRISAKCLYLTYFSVHMSDIIKYCLWGVLFVGIAVSCNIGAAFLIAVIVLAIKCFRGNSSYVDKKVISREYFKRITDPLDKIYGIYSTLSSDKKFLASYQSYVHLEVRGLNENFSPAEHLKYVFLVDIVKCYCKLGQSINITTKEGFGVYYLCAKLFGKHVSYDNLSAFDDQNVSAYSNVLRSIEKSMYSQENQAAMSADTQKEFLVSFALSYYNKTVQKQYLVQLYRFASYTAKADGKVTVEESQWLSKIVEVVNVAKGKNTTTPEKFSDSVASLNSLIGLESVKKEIDTIKRFIQVQNERQRQGLKTTPMSYHCVFTGNPGTGKTTVARCLADIYYSLGIISTNRVVETDRSGLVAEYVGQTAIKTNKVIDSALNGVLFIDEAYSLISNSANDFGQEAVATLLKRMEDDRNRLVVVLAGYTNEMRQFIDSNPGLQSRFGRFIEFPDYNDCELFQIFMSHIQKYDYSITNDARIKLQAYFSNVVRNKDKNFGNARFVRNVFEKTLENQAVRLSKLGMTNKKDYTEIQDCDLAISI